VVSLDKGTLRIVRKIAGKTDYEHGMQVSGLLLPSEGDPDTFRFQTDVRSQEVHLAVASGVLDTRAAKLRFEGHASNVVLSRELYRSLPAEVRRIWDRFEPTGSVNVKVLFDEKNLFHLETELTGVDFAYEYGGLTLTFENLTGRCGFSAASLRLTNVQGLMNGWPVGLDGLVEDFDRERLSMDLSVTAEHVDIEKCKPLLVGVAPHTEVVYYAYSPKGEADVTTRASGGWKQTVGTLKDAGIEFEVVWDTADAGFQAVMDAYFDDTLIGLAVADGPIETPGTQVFKADCAVLKFDRNEPLENAVTVSVTAKPTYSANQPVYEVTA